MLFQIYFSRSYRSCRDALSVQLLAEHLFVPSPPSDLFADVSTFQPLNHLKHNNPQEYLNVRSFDRNLMPRENFLPTDNRERSISFPSYQAWRFVPQSNKFFEYRFFYMNEYVLSKLPNQYRLPFYSHTARLSPRVHHSRLSLIRNNVAKKYHECYPIPYR